MTRIDANSWVAPAFAVKIEVGNGSRTRQSSVFLRRTEVWRLQLPKNAALGSFTRSATTQLDSIDEAELVGAQQRLNQIGPR
jgi:hypothetical protein